MLNENSCNVNTTDKSLKKHEEVMVPYSQVLYLAWDKEIGVRLKEIRNARGLSQAELAKLTEGQVSKFTIISLELGRVDAVSREKLDILLEKMGSDVRFLFPTVTVNLF